MKRMKTKIFLPCFFGENWNNSTFGEVASMETVMRQNWYPCKTSSHESMRFVIDLSALPRS